MIGAGAVRGDDRYKSVMAAIEEGRAGQTSKTWLGRTTEKSNGLLLQGIVVLKKRDSRESSSAVSERVRDCQNKYYEKRSTLIRENAPLSLSNAVRKGAWKKMCAREAR